MTRDVEAALIVKRLVEGLIPESWEADAPLIRLANSRLRAGRKEQEGSTSDWADWDAAMFRRNADEEIADLFNYVREALSRGYRL